MHVNEQEPANDGLTSEDPAPPEIDTKQMIESTQKTFEMFKECRQHDLPGNPFLLAIKENEDKFQKATKESIKQSKRLVEYAADLVQFTEFCADSDNTADDLLEGAKCILNQAKLNNQRASEILNEYLAIVEGLKKVKDEVKDHKAKIIEVGDLIRRNEQENSEEENKLEEATKNKESRSSWIKRGSIAAGIGGTTALAVAIPAIGGAMAIGEIIAVVLGTSTFAGGSVTAFVQSLYAGNDGKQIKLSQEKIEELRGEMERLKKIAEGSIETVDKLTGSLNQTIDPISILESLWQDQVGILENFIDKMEHSTTIKPGSSAKPRFKFISDSEKNKWQRIEKDHRLYTETLKRITVESQIQ